FTSDNGGGFFAKTTKSQKAKPRRTSNAPHSGGKASAAEGGFRVPTIAWWPGTIEAERSTGLMASTMDLLPTFASLAGEPFVSQDPSTALISAAFSATNCQPLHPETPLPTTATSMRRTSTAKPIRSYCMPSARGAGSIS
ncbi:MAG: sulfatase-like hydrolase/transferase, partial [Planctomycetes bacterium]|nr:sulfatase-like hydrolase/transferase [Planctomycetota bacterium]